MHLHCLWVFTCRLASCSHLIFGAERLSSTGTDFKALGCEIRERLQENVYLIGASCIILGSLPELSTAVKYVMTIQIGILLYIQSVMEKP